MTLLHVIESLDVNEDDEVQAFYGKMEKRSREQLDRLCQAFGDEIEVTTETSINNRARGIVQYAVDQQVDLIVMSSHQIDPAADRDRWATISYQVSLVCPCSIMLIKER